MQHIALDPTCPPPRPYGPRTRVGQPRRCRFCRRLVDSKSRSHRCRLCIRAHERGTTPHGPCAVCGLSDRRMLALVELAGGRLILCANHRALVDAQVRTLEALRAEAALDPVQGCAPAPVAGAERPGLARTSPAGAGPATRRQGAETPVP